MFDDDDDHQETILPPTSTLFIVGDDEGREVFATRIAPTGTAVWTDQRFAGQSHYEGMKDLMTAFLDERLRSAGLDETSGGFTAEPGVFALQHGINGDHLDEPLGNLVERWHGILREEIGSLGIPGKALGPMHRLTHEQVRLAPMALVQVLEALDRALPPVPSLDQVGTRLGKGPRDHRTQLASLARFKLDDGGMAVLAFPFSAQMVEPFDQGAMRLSMTLFEKLHKVSDEHPGTVQWSVGQEHAPLDLGHNLFSPGTFQDVRTNDLPTVTLPRATAGMTLVRLQEQLMEVTGGHVGIGWLVEAGDVTARNLDALVNDARVRLVQAGPAVLGPTSRTPGVR